MTQSMFPRYWEFDRIYKMHRINRKQKEKQIKKK